MNRRELLLAAAASAASYGACLGDGSESRGRAPFRLLYSNDTTNITSCVSPYHKAREPFRPEMMHAAVDEAADHGVDAQMLQPGLCGVPWWPSRVYPAAEHYAWLRERYGIAPDAWGRFVLSGGDVVQLFLDRCRQKDQAAFISFRLNDIHGKESVNLQPNEKPGNGAAQGVTRFYAEHPEFRLGSDLSRADQKGLNWQASEVRERQLALLSELCENYDLDGCELDFMRYYSFFRLAETSRAERCELVTDFVTRVRALLDRTARGGQRRWLSARVPCLTGALDALGLDVARLWAAGVDMFTVSASYFTTQRHELRSFREAAPNAAIYLELCHSIWNGAKIGRGYDDFPFRRATVEQLQTTALQAYDLGADGVSLFNFAYYREHGGPGRGGFSEPPFEVLAALKDRAELARASQHYFLAPGWRQAFDKKEALPAELRASRPWSCSFYLVRPATGWQQPGRLRLQFETPAQDLSLTVTWNGQRLQPSTDITEPFPTVSKTMLGTPEQLRGWVVPVELLKAGNQRLELALIDQDPVTLNFVDLSVR